MDLELLNGSVVVLAEQHNPTILHPAFLESQGIVEGAWELAEAPLCTPPVSVVKYANGITFTAELSKFQIVDEGNVADIGQSRAPAMACRYIDTLPHVRYTAVGVNFSGVIDCDQAATFLIQKFLKPGSWHCDGNEPEGLGLKLVYPLDGTSLRLNFDPGEVRRAASGKGESEIKIGGVLVNANFHTAVSGLEEAKVAISSFGARYHEFRTRVGSVFGLET